MHPPISVLEQVMMDRCAVVISPAWQQIDDKAPLRTLIQRLSEVLLRHRQSTQRRCRSESIVRIVPQLWIDKQIQSRAPTSRHGIAPRRRGGCGCGGRCRRRQQHSQQGQQVRHFLEELFRDHD